MGKRIMVAVVFLPLIFVVLYLLPPAALPAALSVLSMIALHEVLWSTGFVKNVKISGYSIVLAGLIPFWVYFGQAMFPALCVLLAYVTLVFAEAIGSKYTITMEKMGGSFLFAVTIAFFLSSFQRIREMPAGEFLVLMPLVCAFCSDAFALFAGLLFGKRKLAPDLSPKKTVEGAAGGLVGAVLGCCLYGLVLSLNWDAEVNYAVLALYGVLGSVISQFGDLCFSYIKRQYNIKDFGNVFPGHGGVLDRFDSVIFCAPLLELLMVLLPAVAGGAL